MLEYKYEYFRLKDKVIFEGKIKEGKNYEGKEFDKNGKLIFQGEYKKGKKWYQESEPFYGNVILLYEKEYYNLKDGMELFIIQKIILFQEKYLMEMELI